MFYNGDTMKLKQIRSNFEPTLGIFRPHASLTITGYRFWKSYSFPSYYVNLFLPFFVHGNLGIATN